MENENVAPGALVRYCPGDDRLCWIEEAMQGDGAYASTSTASNLYGRWPESPTESVALIPISEFASVY